MTRRNPYTIADHCSECERNYVEYMRDAHLINLLSARDPERNGATPPTDAEWQARLDEIAPKVQATQPAV